MGFSPSAASTYAEQIVQEQNAYIQALENELASFFTQQEKILLGISEEALPLLDSIKQLSTGGKRLRALLCYWGWRGASGAPDAPEIVRAGAAIELFQTAALIHDDIIDNSDTRRGFPAVHKQFETAHTQNQWKTSPASYGISSAIIAGDLCLSWSEMMFARIGEQSSGDFEARQIFDLMRTEVMAGQYLDILGEVIDSEGYASTLARAQNVIRYKSAKYSCEHPLALGGALGAHLSSGTENTLVSAYRALGLPLGEGFQLRDDVLGVFGKPQETGKPAGDDLKEGKRTVLVALTEKNAPAKDWALLEDSLGKQDLTEPQIAQLQEIIRACGALAQVESIIEETGNSVQAALLNLSIDPLVSCALDSLTAKILHRAS